MANHPPPANDKNTHAPCGDWSSGAPAAKDASAASSTDSAGHAATLTDSTASPPGADTASWPTTWSKSAPWPPDNHPQPTPPTPGTMTRGQRSAPTPVFQVEVASCDPSVKGKPNSIGPYTRRLR